MRIPTIQLLSRSIIAMQRQNAELEKTQLQISTGLRILKPSDDPTGSVKVLNLNANIGVIDQYSRNSAVAQASLSQQESVLGSINDTLQRVRELTVQGMSPANHDSARLDIALEIEERFKEILSLANTRDANGEYLFSGSLSDRMPFINQGGTVTYQGDQVARELQVGDGTRIASRDPGDATLMGFTGGDGVVDVKAATGNRGTLLVGQFSGDKSFVRDTYTIRFTPAGNSTPGAMAYSVTDSASPTPNVVATGTYRNGEAISFGGVRMALSGTPADNDSVLVRPAQTESVFAVVQGLAAALRMPAVVNGVRSPSQNLLAQGLGNLDRALGAINDQRAAVGARLGSIDTLDSINADFRLQLDTLKSQTQDLDYADALTRFNMQLSSLQAAQQAFVKTSELSLFNYL